MEKSWSREGQSHITSSLQGSAYAYADGDGGADADADARKRHLFGCEEAYGCMVPRQACRQACRQAGCSNPPDPPPTRVRLMPTLAYTRHDYHVAGDAGDAGNGSYLTSAPRKIGEAKKRGAHGLPRLLGS